jgi:hypothetical protein
MEKVHVLPPDGKLILRRLFLCRQVLTDPTASDPSYYDLYCALQVLPPDADWRQILATAIAPEKILQTV